MNTLPTASTTCECQGLRPGCLCQAPAECTDCGDDGTGEPLIDGRCGRCAEMAGPMTPDRLQLELASLLAGVRDGNMPAIQSALTFDDAGVLCSNAGVVLRFVDGAAFQLSIVRCR